MTFGLKMRKTYSNRRLTQMHADKYIISHTVILRLGFILAEGSSCGLYILAGFFAALRMTRSEKLMDIGSQVHHLRG